jgi:diguanylate cyclase (GGDEF)-like protein
MKKAWRMGPHHGAWLAFVVWCLANTAAATVLPIIDIGQLQHQQLAGTVEFLSLNSHIAFSDVRTRRFEQLTPNHVNQGISDNIFWLRFRLHNSAKTPTAWLLHPDTSYVDNLSVYIRDQGSNGFASDHLSDRQPFHTRPVNYRYLAHEHVTPAGKYTDVYVKLHFVAGKPDSVSLNLQLWNKAHFWPAASQETVVYGTYYGALFILFILSLLIALLLKKPVALYYAGLLASTACMWLLLNGYGFQYLWPKSVYWQNEGFHITYLLFTLFALQFSKAFLRTRELQPRVHRLLNLFQILALAGLASRAFGYYAPALHLSFGLLFVVALLIPAAGWFAYRGGLSHARWYTLAWLAYSAGLVVCILSAYTGSLQWSMQVLDYLQIGSLLETVFLMIAMAEWLLHLDTDRRKALALANQDPLTGLGNRRLLQIQYEVLKERFSKDRQPVFLIMIDLDHFKQVNDRYGHEAGDHVLREVALLIEASSRDGDVCVRYGGEEFAILLRADDIDAVWQVAERIREQFANRPTTYNDHLITHTLSSGITQVLSQQETLSVQEMMSRADAALYRGKSAGRNCSIIFNDDEDTNEPDLSSVQPGAAS